ncbi:MAG: XRE family transcriptional regulator [Candidatus Electrothrix sp.]
MNKEINTELLLLARETRGMSQSLLAKKLGVTQAAVSKAEKGQLQLTDTLLRDIANVLGYPVGFFYQTGHSYPTVTPFHRKKTGLGKKLQQKIEANANVRRLHVQKLLDSIDIEPRKLPFFDLDEYATASNAAIALRRYLRLPKGPINNLTSIIEEFGILVLLCDFETQQLDGFTIFGKGNTPLIFVNKDMPWCRIRFTLAHELGHIVMNHVHRPEIEEEANEFASSFLMPEEDIEKDFWRKRLYIKDLAELKPYWKVSMQALLMRAKNLGYLTSNQARHLWVNMGKAGFRKKEPSFLDIPPEQPTLFELIINLHKNELEYTDDDLLTMLTTSAEDFYYLYPSFRKQEKKPVKLRLVQ